MNRTPAVQQELWSRIKDHFTTWYHELDSKPTMIALSQYAAHSKLNDVPVWSFIIGSSSSGKSIPIKAVSYLKDTHKLDEINKNSFLSGARNSEGILETLKEQANGTQNGVILIPDFSTLLNLHRDERPQILAQLRKIYDGELKKDTATKGVQWKGKITIIAAATPAIDKYWAVERDLGERFIEYRIPQRSKEKLDDTNERVLKQIKHEKEIDKNFKELIVKFVGVDDNFPDTSNISNWRESGLLSFATLVALMRTTVSRDQYSKHKDIEDVSDPECSTRLTKSLAMLAIGNAMLMREPIVKDYNINVAKQVAWATIPLKRLKVLDILRKATSSNYSLNISQIAQSSNIPWTTMNRVIEDLNAMNITTQVRSGQSIIIQLDPFILELLSKAKLIL
jgi:DNA-binding transcriptional ArsR family regulator